MTTETDGLQIPEPQPLPLARHTPRTKAVLATYELAKKKGRIHCRDVEMRFGLRLQGAQARLGACEKAGALRSVGGGYYEPVEGFILERDRPIVLEPLDALVHIHAVDAELARRCLSDFVRLMWPVIEPAAPIRWAWYLDAICEHLEAVTRGEIRRLIVNMPPRHLKSSVISVLWPCWEWLQDPTIRYLTASYRLDLAVRDSVRSRRVMATPLYRALIRPDRTWKFTSDQNEKSRYENDRTGVRLCTAPGAGTTGEGGNRRIVDDPHDVRGVVSDTERKATLEWLDIAFSSRANDPKRDAMVVVMQRLHENDATAHLLGQGGYEHLCLPTLYECDSPARRTTSIGFIDPRTEEGELLSPDHMGPAEVAEAKLRLGSAGFAAQHQQRPAPASGLMFQRAWFRRWDVLPPKFDEVMCSVDLAFRGKGDRRSAAAEVENLVDPDYCVFDIWGRVGSNLYLVDERRGQWDFVRAMREMIELCAQYPQAKKKLIEAKANGDALISMLKDKIPGIVPFEPGAHGSKVQRATSCVPYVEAGNIHIPSARVFAWSEQWLDELCTFPLAKNDDRVDAFSQVCITWLSDGAAAALKRLQAMGKW